VRYKSPPAPAHIRVTGSGLEVEFERPLRAVTPGQAAVLYDGDRVIGGATIAKAQSETGPYSAAGILR
jgi:tRNA-uridine 2-sulfurtransferase